MRSLATALSTELVSDGHSGLATCLEIRTATPLYRTNWPVAIVFDGDTYTPDNFTFGDVGGALLPASPTMRLSVQNVRDPVDDTLRPWSNRLDSATLNGIQVDVRILMLSQLSDTTAQVDETKWVITQTTLRGNFCEMDIGPPFNLAGYYVPDPYLRAPRCRWEFKDRYCRSESDLTTCPTKDLVACKARHPELKLRFSQFPFDTDLRHVDG